MTAGGPPRLTEKQNAVMERVDRRVPIKVIAGELNVSESRINQHIRKLKDAYGVSNLNDLVDAHRVYHAEETGFPPYRNSSSIKKQLPEHEGDRPFGQRDDPGELVFSDALAFPADKAWDTPLEPQVVPGVLDGNRAVLYRLAAIIGIAFGFVAAVILVVTASVSLTEALDGEARVPVEKKTPAG